jgi:hypothetical protein
MTTATATAPAADQKKMDLQKEAVCLSVKMGMLRTRRRIKSDQIETDADKSMVHVAKDIMESEQLHAVEQFHGQVRAYLKGRCLPSPFRSGVYLIKLQLVGEVMDALGQFEQQQKELIEAFMTFYAECYEKRNDPEWETAKKLGSLFDASDYPDPAEVRKAFRFQTQIWEIGTPGALRKIDRALYEREAAKMQNVWEEARQSITGVLLQEFRDMTAKMADRLAPGEDGKPKIFRDTLVSNLQEWLDVFDKRALTDDQELIDYVKKARAMVSGIKPETVRESESLKAELASEMKNLTANLDKAIVERPGRMIQLED